MCLSLINLFSAPKKGCCDRGANLTNWKSPDLLMIFPGSVDDGNVSWFVGLIGLPVKLCMRESHAGTRGERLRE